jgi:DNA-binding transcriptional ArsR family regulator
VATNASVVIEALGDPTRRAIFERLAQGSAAVGELAQVVPVTRSAVSQHLKILKGVGLVSDRAVGTRRVYTVDPEALAALREYFDAFWHQSLAASARAAEHTKEEP